jgi:hypothetical protein
MKEPDAHKVLDSAAPLLLKGHVLKIAIAKEQLCDPF